MQVVGIVAEYNPFHTGHAYQIAKSRQLLGRDSAITAVMSGNWVQQADCAIADKWLRARLALMGGVDLVLELPTVWATASAESFAQGAVKLFEATGVVRFLSFGSECGDVDQLRQVAACLDSPACQAELRRFLDKGMPFAACRQAAVRELLSEELSQLLASPNNNLGIEYIRALNAVNSDIQPLTIPRKGAAHNSILEKDAAFTVPGDGAAPLFVSATQLRQELREGNWAQAAPYLVPGGRQLLEAAPAGLPALEHVERAILARLRTMTADDWAKLPDSGAAEGLPQRLERAGRQCGSIEEFYHMAKTKRYTHARLRRLLLWAYLGITAADLPDAPPYLRVLGFNSRGRQVLREMRDRAALPILTKPAHGKELNPPGQRLLNLEARCTDLYDLCLPTVPTPGREWMTGPVIME